jgi:hypothetical protein
VTPEAATDWRELARRTGNGVDVALLWNPSVNRVKVAVSDAQLCHHLDFDIAGSDALSAFYRPFAQATTNLQAMSFGPGARPSW